MSETLKTSGESSAENTGENYLKVLSEMSSKFDANKARTLAEQDKPKQSESPTIKSDIDKKVTHLMALPEKKEKILTPEDAANEYLSLLDELSQDFSNPFYKNGTEHGGQQHTAPSIVRDLGLKYSDNPHYRHHGYIGTEANSDDGVDYTVERMGVADFILTNEIRWRTEGEKVSKKMEQFDQEIADLDADYSKKGRLGKFFGRKKYEKARENLERSKRSAEAEIGAYNANIAKELAISYNEKGDYDRNGGNHGISQNEARNRQFFGLDDPERAKKVERAIELRQKYESEWNKKK